MNTKNLPLRAMAKAVMIVMLLGVTGMTKVAKAQQGPTEWELQQPYLFYLVYADEQAHETEMPHRPATCEMRYEQLPHTESAFLSNWQYYYNIYDHAVGVLGMAKNERTGFQVFYREQEKSRNLKVEVANFTNGSGDTIPHTVYFEEFFKTDAYSSDSLAEALVPYRGELKRTTVEHNKMFYVELKSAKEQPSGIYTSTISLYEDDTVFLTSKTVTAKVWNFTLPESHYSEVVMGLHNNNSGYVCTQNFLIYNGVNMSNGTPVTEEDRLLAKQILIGYQDFLLDHGVSTYELPRWLIDDDPKATELTMADPRRKTFAVPAYHMDSSKTVFNQEESNIIAQYKALVYDNPFIKDKAYFHVLDEPDVLDESIIAILNNKTNDLINKWGPDYHAVAPFNIRYDAALELFEGKVDILCPHQGFFNPMNFTNYDALDDRIYEFMEKPHTWRYYPTDKLTTGDVVCYISPLLSVGTMRRAIFWQQYVIKSDGILHWNCASYGNNPWTNKTLPEGQEVWWTGQGNNGDGILIYPGAPINEEPTMPIASLRLKQIDIGLTDYDYLHLVEEFLGEERAQSFLRIVFNTIDQHICSVMNKEPFFGIEGFYGWTSFYMNKAKYRMGEALSAANTEHTWGEWQTAVLPDETHCGIEIRTCDSCGAQESHPKTFLYRFLGTEDNQWSNLSNWEYQPESLPVLGEAVIIASDCEVDSSQTVSSVTVKNGFNLTIKEGATLTSRLVSTEENAQIIIENGGQLVHNSEGVMATVKKNVPGHETDGGYVFISSPVAGDTDPSQVVGLLTGDYDFYRFDAAASDGLEWRNYRTSTFDMTNGTGYLYANPDEVELNFTGTVKASNTPEIKMPSFAEGYFFDGWNLMGNPFTCNAYLNSDAEGMAFYRMNANGDGYEAATDAIHPMEGFFVQATAANQTFTIGREQPEGTRNELHLQIVQNTNNSNTQHAIDNVIIRFGKGNTLEKLSFREHNAKLYIPQDDKNYAVVNADRQGELPLNYKVTEDGTYMLSFSTEGVDFSYLHLIDNQTGTDVDLLQTLNYSFDAKVTDIENRFKVVYSINSTK